MRRLIVWTVLLAILASVAVWLADRPGSVTLVWLGYRIDTDVAFLAFCIAVVAATVAIVYRGWAALRAAPGTFGLGRRSKRRDRGYRALTRGMVAVAAGDAGEAERQARRAAALLEDPPLTMLLQAQAAQLNGDDAAARRYFEAMLERPDLAFLGLRGLLMQSERAGDGAAALGYARRAHAMNPKTPWLPATLFDLEARAGGWHAALAVAEQGAKHGAMARGEARRRKAIAQLALTEAAERAGDPAEALARARAAYREAPDAAAAIRLVALLTEAGRGRAAARIAERAWAANPHPELARLVRSLTPEEPLKGCAAVERLVAANPDHAESHLAVAEAALAAKLWGQARNRLERAAAFRPTTRVYRLLAELEEAEKGDRDAARRWLVRAAQAPPDFAWVCGACGAAAVRWAATCGKCNAIGAQAWTEPPRIDVIGHEAAPAEPALPAVLLAESVRVPAVAAPGERPA
jgi:HemY protein